METKKRKIYSKEFKMNAVKLIIDEGRNAAELARDLDISANMLYLWKKKYLDDQEEAFPGLGKLKPSDEYVRGLERDVKRLKDECDILKKAAIYFAKEK